jgi:hypothetical protein
MAISCRHHGTVRGSVIKTHGWPLPDVTASYVLNDAYWNAYGWSPNCHNGWVEDMEGHGYCYSNPTQDGTRLKPDGCKRHLVSAPGDWNHENIDGYYDASGGGYTLKTTVFAAQQGILSGGRWWSGTCSIRNGRIPSGSRFQCDPHLSF